MKVHQEGRAGVRHLRPMFASSVCEILRGPAVHCVIYSSVPQLARPGASLICRFPHRAREYTVDFTV